MELNDLTKIGDLIEGILTSSGILIGAIWAYQKFVRTREKHPKVQFGLDIQYLGIQGDGMWLNALRYLRM
jgi:hypothetical protein